MRKLLQKEKGYVPHAQVTAMPHEAARNADCDEFGEVDYALHAPAMQAAAAHMHARNVAEGWRALGVPASLLFGMVWQTLRRREVLLMNTKNFAPANDPVMHLESDDKANEYLTGWIVKKLTEMKFVKKEPSLVQVMKALTGPKMQNSSNFAYTLDDMKRNSLHTGVRALQAYIKEVALVCTSLMTRGALFAGRQHAFTNVLGKLEESGWLREFWLVTLDKAGVKVEYGEESSTMALPSSGSVAAPPRAQAAAAAAAVAPSHGSAISSESSDEAEPITDLDLDGPCVGGGHEPGSSASPTKCVVSEALARQLQGLVVERYLHQRQNGELRRQKATGDAEQQAS